MKAWASGAAVVCALVSAGCSAGANVSPITIGRSDTLCTDMGAFQGQAAQLEAASVQGDLTTIRTQVSGAADALAHLQADAAKLPDKVNGHLVRDDLAVAASTYSALKDALAAAKDGDPNGLTNALASVQSKEGQQFTQATGRLDAYTKKVCGLVVSSPTSTNPSSTTTQVVGPVGSTTTVPTTTVPTTGPTTTVTVTP